MPISFTIRRRDDAERTAEMYGEVQWTIFVQDDERPYPYSLGYVRQDMKEPKFTVYNIRRDDIGYDPKGLGRLRSDDWKKSLDFGTMDEVKAFVRETYEAAVERYEQLCTIVREALDANPTPVQPADRLADFFGPESNRKIVLGAIFSSRSAHAGAPCIHVKVTIAQALAALDNLSEATGIVPTIEGWVEDPTKQHYNRYGGAFWKKDKHDFHLCGWRSMKNFNAWKAAA